jgi:hypothetical protein
VRAISERIDLRVMLGLGLAGASGALSAAEPKLALGVMALVIAATLAFFAPVATLLALLFLTAIVPFDVQNQFSVGGGAEAPGLLVSDLLLLLALARAALVLAQHPLERRRFLAGVVLALFLAVAAMQFLRGVRMGRAPSEVGFEFRALLGFATFFVAIPLLDDERARRRLFAGLLGLALALGAWGMVQWFGGLEYTGSGDVGVREGVALTTGGRGQLQGGLFAFPVAVIGCYAALLSGGVRSLLARLLLVASITLNAASCLVTYERTFWLVTILGVAFVTVKARGVAKAKAILAAPLVMLAAYAVLATAAPAELTTARERFLSLGQYESDRSLRFRVVESEHVIDKIRESPVRGSALGASIYWGRPWDQVRPASYTYSHNGYLWLAWKLGIPFAAVLVLLIAAVIVVRKGQAPDELAAAIRTGAEASLLALLVATVLFPSFNGLAITPTLGVLLALALLARPASRQETDTP